LSLKSRIKVGAYREVPAILILSVFAHGFCGFAHAQCENKNSTADMVQCLSVEIPKADTELNRVYQAKLKRLQPADVAKLRKAQRAWIVYRDAHCDAESSLYEGGSIQPAILGNCKLTLTQQRTKELQAAYPDR
jgi:uncharacterized protein YecT (DUF1311 family)